MKWQTATSSRDRLDAADGKGFAELDDRIALLEMTALPRGEANYLAARPKGDVTTLKPSTEKSGYQAVRLWPRQVKVWEATMSTPIRHAKHIDPALMYAPPRVRERDLVPTEPSVPAVNSDSGSAPRESRGDRRSQRHTSIDT